MPKIKQATLESIIIAAQNTYPDEFIALLGADKKKVIKELVILPSTYGSTFSSIRRDLVPFDSSIVGSVHSHPSHSNRPSSGDLKAFPGMGEVHLIICMPFDLNSIKAYDVKGNELEIEAVE